MNEVLERIEEALDAAGRVLQRFTPGAIEARRKDGGDPVTEADLTVNEVLLEILPRNGEGWLSEETRDDPARLECRRVWVVDPIDGTKEFVTGIPEWCVSIGWVENGRARAGGIFNPAAGHRVVGALGEGVRLNGEPASAKTAASLAGAVVLASRSEIGRGEWSIYDDRPFTVRPMGSVAYKMGRVAAGLDEATWTLAPKNEWDVAAGTALVEAAGGRVFVPTTGERPPFNQPKTKMPGLVALGAGTVSLWDGETFTR